MSNVRINNGTAIYTAAYDSPTVQLLRSSTTTLLTCKSDVIEDEMGKTITNSTPPVTVNERLFPSVNESSPYLVKKQYSNGDLEILGSFDELSLNIFGGQTLNYNFNVLANNSVINASSCDVTVSFSNTTITANSGGYGVATTGGAAGTYSIVTNGQSVTGGVNGITGSVGFGGNAGGPVGTAIGNRDIGGLLTFIAAEGTYSTSTFGAAVGGSGWMAGGREGNFAGGGAGGSGAGGGGYQKGGNAAFLLQYTAVGVTYYEIYSQNPDQITSTGGSITFPHGTTYVKFWAIGKGGMSAMSGTYTQYSAAAGGSGGAAYAEFSASILGGLTTNLYI
jgi:hypothetical protein